MVESNDWKGENAKDFHNNIQQSKTLSENYASRFL